MAKAIRKYGTLVGIVAVILFFWINIPDTFMTPRNWLNISQQVSMLAVTAFTMTIVMVMGDFDLSVGSMASLAGIVAALAFKADLPIIAAIGLALAVGLGGGLLNGFLVSYVGILPFVATLGTLTIFSGFAFLISGGKTIFGRDIPEAFSGFARDGIPLFTSGEQVITLPYLTLMALVILLVVWVLLEHTVYGRRLYAIGGNAEAARLAGVRVRILRFSAFGLTGLGAAIAGLMYAARVASANPTQGSGLMLIGDRRRVSRHDHERGGRAAGSRHVLRRADPRRARQWPDADERGFLCPRNPRRLDHRPRRRLLQPGQAKPALTVGCKQIR